MEAHAVFQVDTGAAQKSCEAICGDSFAFLPLGESKFAVLLSDGMGIGEAARQESQTVIRLLQAMLKSHFALDMMVKTVNAVLLLRRTEETFSTVDLFLLDLGSGEGTLLKTAAAPTFFKRRQQWRTLCSHSLPVGILRELDVQRQSLRLEAEDVLVFVSDGILEPYRAEREDDWLRTLLEQNPGANCQPLAERILKEAIRRKQNRIEDDMTVLCLRVKRL